MDQERKDRLDEIWFLWKCNLSWDEQYQQMLIHTEMEGHYKLTRNAGYKQVAAQKNWTLAQTYWTK